MQYVEPELYKKIKNKKAVELASFSCSEGTEIKMFTRFQEFIALHQYAGCWILGHNSPVKVAIKMSQDANVGLIPRR